MKLNHILLIDDDDATNFINKLIIDQANLANEISICKNGQAGLDFIKKNHNEEDLPDLILLDINMPVMNGWEFVEEFQKIAKLLGKNISLVILTTSQNPDEKVRSKTFEIIDDFLIKPLSAESLKEIATKHLQKQKNHRYK